MRLQDELQRFTRPWYRPRTRTLRVFRDQTNLQASPDLWGTIEEAMSSSRWLLLVASPRSAQSAGVRRELTWWRERRGTGNICIALTDGELRWDKAANDFDWSAATALSREALGQAFEREPAWIDLRPVTLADDAGRSHRLRLFPRSIADPRLQDATASLIAEIKNVPKDTLMGEHLRRSRQTRRVVTSALSILVILLTAAIVAASIAVSQANRAVHQATISEAGQLAAIAETLTGSHLDLAELFAAEAYHLYPDAQTRAALFQAVTADPRLVRYLQATGTVSAVAASADGNTAVAGAANGDVLRWNLTDFKRTVAMRLPAGVSSVAVSADGKTIAAAGGSATEIWILGQGVRSVPVPGKWTADAVAVSPSGRYVAISMQGPAHDYFTVPHYFVLTDERTGSSVRSHIQTFGSTVSLGFSGEAQLVVMDNTFGNWERLTIPGLAQVSASSAHFGAHNYAHTLSPTGEFISYSNGGPPLSIWTTLSAPTPENAPLAAWEVGDGPNALAVSADGRRAADADAGTIYVSNVTKYAAATSATMLPLAGNVTINDNGLTFAGPSDNELLSASGSLITLWSLDQYSRISAAAAVDIPSGCSACACPDIAVRPKASQAVIRAGFGAAMLVNLPPSSVDEQLLPQSNTYGSAVWSLNGQEFSILTPGDDSGEIWSSARGLVLIRSWAVRPSVSQTFDSPNNSPASMTLTADGKRKIEIDEAGNIVVRDSATGIVEHELAGPISPLVAGVFSRDQGTVDSEGSYAAIVVMLPSRANTYMINIKNGAVFPVPGGPVAGGLMPGKNCWSSDTARTLEVRTAGQRDGRPD